MIKRVSLLILITLSLFLISCDRDTNGNNKKDTLDFDGRKIVYLSNSTGGSLKPTAGTTVWGDMILSRVKNVQEELNFVFEFEESSNIATYLQGSFASGSIDVDIVNTEGDKLIPLYSQGVFVDLNTIEAIDLTNEEKYGTPSLRKFAEYKGGCYGLYGVGNVNWPNVNLHLFDAILINDDLVDYFGAEHPLEFHEKKIWNFTTFKNYLGGISRNNPGGDNIYSLNAWYGHYTIGQAALYANGCPLVVQDSNGKSSFGYSSSQASNALEWARGIFSMKDYVTTDGEEGDFASGKSTLFLGHSAYFFSQGENSIQKSLKNVSFIFFPYGPDVEYGSICTSYYDTPFSTSLVKTGDEQETGFMLDYLLEPLYGDEYQAYMKDYFFPDYNDSYELYMNEVKNASYLYSAQIQNVQTPILDAIIDVTKGEKSVTEAVGAITDMANAEIDRQFN